MIVDIVKRAILLWVFLYTRSVVRIYVFLMGVYFLHQKTSFL